jgi:hypothetical protein
MFSKKPISCVNHVLYGIIKPIQPGENIREWEKTISMETNFKLVNRPIENPNRESINHRIFSITIIKPTMILIQDIFNNLNYKNSELFSYCEPAGRIKLIETVINNKKVIKPEDYKFDVQKKNKKKTTKTNIRDGFGSQVSFWIDSADKTKQYKVKVFNGGKIQVPGVVDKNDIIDVIEYLRNFLNERLSAIQGFIPITISPNSMTDLGEARKCDLIIPEDISIDFFELKKRLIEVKQNQMLSITQKSTNPLFDIIWPIFKIDGDPYQKKCFFNVFNPRYGVDKITMSRIEFNSIKKEKNGVFYYSIILSGSADERHINYIYRFLWEFFSRYQNYIFYKKNSEFDEVDISLYKEIEALKKRCLEETI